MPYLIRIYKKPKKGSAWADVKTNHDFKRGYGFFPFHLPRIHKKKFKDHRYKKTVKINMSKKYQKIDRLNSHFWEIYLYIIWKV